MKKNFLAIIALFLTLTCHSQTKGIIGSWISRDTINKIHFFIKRDGTIEKTTAVGKEDVWNQVPETGTYTFEKENLLIIIWQDKSIEKIKVKFIGNNAAFQFMNQKGKLSMPNIFLRVLDAEVPN